MRVKRIGWAGTRTSKYSAMVAFLQAVLGLTTSQQEADFAAFQLPEGGTFEVFGPGDQDHEHFSTGPVVGFVVDDLTGAVRELEAAGVELLSGQMDEPAAMAPFSRAGWKRLRAHQRVERSCHPDRCPPHRCGTLVGRRPGFPSTFPPPDASALRDWPCSPGRRVAT
jgi:predicted enzyme related to lactoylglutathione lyase